MNDITDIRAEIILFKLFASSVALFSVATILTSAFDDYRVAIFVLLIFCSLCLMIATRNNVILFVISFVIAYSNYSAGLVNTFPPYFGYDTIYSSDPVSALGMSLLLLFTALLLVFMPTEIRPVGNIGVFDRWQGVKYSLVLVIAISVVLILIFFTCSSGFSVGSSGRADNNSIFEYAYVLFIFGFMIAGRNIKLRTAMIAVALLYLAQVFLGGNRASGLAIVLLLFVLFVADRITWFQLIPYLLLGFLALVSLGYFRGGDSFFLFKLFDALNELGNTGGVWDTASYAFHQSIAFLRLDDVIGLDEKVYLLKQWILSWFVGSSAAPDSALSTYCQALYPGMGGGFLPLYAYFYLGLPGVVVSSGFIAWLFKKISLLSDTKSDLIFCISLSVSTTCCRWYIYSPAPLTSSLFFISIIYITLQLFLEKPQGNNEANSPASLNVSKRGGYHS